MPESSFHLVTKELNSFSTEFYKLYNPNCKFHSKGHRFSPNLVNSFEKLHQSQSSEFHEHAANFYNDVLKLRNRYNLYPQNNVLTNQLGNLATAHFDLIFPDDTMNGNLFSFSCEDEFKSQNPNFTRLNYNLENKVLVMSKDIKKLSNLESLRESVLNDFKHKLNKFERLNDTEYKLLEYILRVVQSKIELADRVFVGGTVIIESERSICESCDNVIATFKKIFPNITLIISSYYGDEHCRYEKEGIVFTPNRGHVLSTL